MEMLITILPPLIATILIEYGVLRFLKERSRRVLWSSVVVNILTNVPLNLLVIDNDYDWSVILIGEVIVILVETLWYFFFVKAWGKAFVYGFLCNAISFLSGVLFLMILDLVFYY